MNTDAELLRRYGESQDNDAFAELVRRHVDLVHSAALRQVNGDMHLAADVTQVVFTDLARKARQVAGHRVLAGWLFTSTRFTAAKIVRGEQRRRVREQEAQSMQDSNDEAAAQLDWERVRPVLDAALAELKDDDREAVLLRYFEGRDFAELGARLNLNANAARMRVDRALDKLHALLARRGVTSSAAALAAALGAHAVTAAPAGLAASVTGAAMAAAGALGGAGAAVGFMSMTKLQMGLAAALAVGGTTAYVVQANVNAGLRENAARLREEVQGGAEIERENLRFAKAVAEAEDLARDDTELARLQSEAGELRGRLSALAAREAELERQRAAARAESVVRYDVAELDRRPVPTHQVPPEYPQAFRHQSVPGRVVVEFVVDVEGAVRDATVLSSSRPEFEPVALAAVQQWRFQAGTKGGRAVNTRLQVPIVFAPAGNAEAGEGQVANERGASSR